MRKAENTAFNTGLNTLTINLSTYIDGLDTKVAPIIASGSIVVDTTKPRASENDIAIQAIAPTSDWKLSSASYDRTKIKALNKQIAELRFKEINAIVVVKNGELLIEQYYNGSNRNTLHNPRSVGKTFASTVMGIAINEGYIKNEEQVLSDFYDLKSFKHYSPAKAKVTIKELLTMSSNFDANDFDSGSAGNEENMYPLDDWVKFALDLPMKESKQNISNWQYFTAGVVVLGDILHQKVPNGLEQYAHKTLFAPLAINNYQWQYTPTGVANTAGGLALRALDFAKFGQLYQNNGRWNNTQVVPQQWVKESLSKQVPRGQSPDEGHYGYLFWHDTFPIGNKMMNVAYATGNGGNKVFIFKDIDLVVVINASAYNRIYAHPQVNEMMANYILPAVLE
jgi:CubicO group peptidase (beta-lactamase class C family)